MAMMSPKELLVHIDHETLRKFATDILQLLDAEKPKAKPKAKAEEKEEEK